MSLGVLNRKREMEYTQRHIAGSVCTVRIASPEELNKILKERGNQMGKRGPKPGFKRDKKVNQVELIDQATIKGSKALASAVRAGIEEAIDAAPLNYFVDGVGGFNDFSEVDAVVSAILDEDLVTEKAEPLSHKVCRICGMPVALSGFNVLAQSCQACEDARFEGHKPSAPLTEKADTFDWDVLAAQTKGAVLQEREQVKASASEIKEALMPQMPPLGLTPKWLHDESRMYEILGAVGRYLEAKEPVPFEWMDELETLIGPVLNKLRGIYFKEGQI